MRPRPLYLALLCLVLFVFSCSNSDKPTELVTSPAGALRDAGSAVLNACPTLSSSSSLTVAEDGHANHIFSAHDDDGDELTIIITDTPNLGSANPAGSSRIVYDPRFNRCGSDQFKFKVTDGTCDSPEITVNVTVTCVNDCPEAFDDEVAVAQDGSVNFYLEFSEPDSGEELTFALSVSPDHGTVVFDSEEETGTYTPAAGYCGPDFFSYTVNDGECTSDAAGVNVTVVCPDTDADDDGVPDDDDDCADSIIGATVQIGGCETGVLNTVSENGCTLADAIDAQVEIEAATAANHGKFVSAMAKYLNGLVRAGTINLDQKDAIMSCIGSSGFGKIDAAQ